MGVSRRLTVSGQAHNGYCNLFGVTVNKNTIGSAIVSLRNSLDASGEILWECTLTGKQCIPKNFDPILLFATGIYLEITGSIYSVIIECL